jgi:tetratricopeptide (TPR) repeat protein
LLKTQLEQGLVTDAVHALVTRMALTKLRFGADSERAVRAQLTVAKAYLDLRGLPRQALKHASQARAAFLRAQEQHSMSHNSSAVALLEASLLHTIAAAQLAVAALPLAKEKGRRSGGSTSGRTAKRSNNTTATSSSSLSSSALLNKSSAGRTSTPPGSDDVRSSVAKLAEKARKNLATAATVCQDLASEPGAVELTVRMHATTASLHQHLGEYDDASACLVAALDALSVKPAPFPDSDLLAAELHLELARVEAARGRNDAAKAAREASLRATEAQHGEHSTELVPHLLASARALMEVGDDAAAIGPLERALRVLANGVPGGDPTALGGKIVCGINDDVPHLREWLDAADERAMLHVRLSEFREALTLVKSVAPLKSELYGPRCGVCAGRHAQAYCDTHKPTFCRLSARCYCCCLFFLKSLMLGGLHHFVPLRIMKRPPLFCRSRYCCY